MSSSKKTPRPKLSIIVPFYQGTQSDDELRECLDSIDYPCEVLLCHDGPLQRVVPHDCLVTAKRYNDFGHTLRDKGIRQAHGDYLIFCNADNVFYPGTLKALSEEPEADIYICKLMMRGCTIKIEGDTRYLTRTGNPKDMAILTGNPPVYKNIDCMQLVMKRQLWLKYGWYDKSQNSDGHMYEQFCKDHEPKFLDIILGEHR